MHTLRKIADKMADATVVLSYTSVGHALRKPLWGEEGAPSMEGKVAVVTGANSGIGFATARALASSGATVVMACRNLERGELARQRILTETRNERVAVEALDVSELSSVRDFAARFSARHERLDVLVHNAGVLVHERSETSDGVETTFATHVLGPFALTHLLRGMLTRSQPSRVIWVTSGGMYTTALDLGDLQSRREPFDGVKAYARCKRAQVMLTEAFARHLGREGVHVHAMHPGWADTPGVRRSLPSFHKVLAPLLRSDEQGADTAVWLSTSPEALRHNGCLWFDRARRRTHVVPWTRGKESDSQVLWDTCERLAGIEQVTAADACEGERSCAPAAAP
jgi:NAD(P)-dependent dehydrogenase (short-subunit alcohol dehydrogenase family)